MHAGLDAGVPFEQVCGGNAECSTCHIQVPIKDIKTSEEGLIGKVDKDELY